MKRKTILSLFGALALAATTAFATTTSPPAATEKQRYSMHMLKLSQGAEQKSFRDLLPAKADNLKTTLGGSMPVAEKQGDGLGVPVMRVGAGVSTVDYIASDKASPKDDGITGLQKKMGGKNGDSKAGMFYFKGNNGARAAPAASMGKIGDMSAVRLDGNSYIDKVIGRSYSLPS